MLSRFRALSRGSSRQPAATPTKRSRALRRIGLSLAGLEQLERRVLPAPLFVPAPAIPVGNDPAGITVGDFNGDGRPDLAVANFNSNNVSILLNGVNGNPLGTFTPAPDPPIKVGQGAYFIVSGDFEGDGKPEDLAVTNYSDNTVSVLLKNGDGTFKQAVYNNIPVNHTVPGPIGIVVGDFDGRLYPNGQPILDLAVANQLDNSVGILLGSSNGDGTFSPGSNFGSVGANPYALAVGDFDGNGKADLAVATSGDASVYILLGNGDGKFHPATEWPIPGVAHGVPAIAAGDFNADGKPDLAVTNYSSKDNTVNILLGDGFGNFSGAKDSPISVGLEPMGVVSGDFNRDGKADLAVADHGSNAVSVLLGRGDGSFTPAPDPSIQVGTSPTGIALGDFNGDGWPDLAVINAPITPPRGEREHPAQRFQHCQPRRGMEWRRGWNPLERSLQLDKRCCPHPWCFPDLP